MDDVASAWSGSATAAIRRSLVKDWWEMPEADSSVVHRLMCRHCLHTVQVAGPVYSAWVSRIADEHSFSDVSRQLEIFGTCRGCAVLERPSTR